MAGAAKPIVSPTPCPLCASDDHDLLIRECRTPVLLNRLYPSAAQARRAATGRFRLVQCTQCGFVYNDLFDPSLIVYDRNYENDQSISQRFASHLDDIRRRLNALLGKGGVRILEVGCGQGAMLESLVRTSDATIQAVGLDPAWRPRTLPPAISIEAIQLDGSTAARLGQFDLIYARHVIEHVQKPVEFLAAMKPLLTPGGSVCIETPTVDWCIEFDQMQDFFYEHCNYFSVPTLTDTFTRAGFHGVKIDKVFDGQYMWATSTSGASSLERSRRFGLLRHDHFFKYWRKQLASSQGNGGVAIWGAGAKGVTFALHTDPDAKNIVCLIDVNPAKQDQYTPLSGHPVLSPASAAALDIRTILVMNWNYIAEIQATSAEAGLTARIIRCSVNEPNGL